MQDSNIMALMSSHKAFIFAVSGAAIGIGSIWRMPYMIGEHGGSLFIFCYLFFIFILGLPAMIAEIIVGKIGRLPPLGSLQLVARSSQASHQWGKIAWVGTIGSVFILSFYCVVSGWSIYYLGQSLTGLHLAQESDAEKIFNTLLSNPASMLLYSTVFLVLTFVVSAFQVNKGIERLNDTLMPLLYLILIGLVVYATSLPGFDRAVYYLLHPDWSKLTASMLLTAMGMAFFTLATGACCLMAYGAYIPKSQSIVFSVSVVAAINLLVTLCAGIAIFSIVFSYGLDASSGPGLIFMALPVALNDMPLGLWVMPAFFFLLLIACWTSSVNLAEPLVTALSAKFNNRKKGAFSAAILIWCLSLIPALSFNLFKHIKIAGMDIFSAYTGLATDVFLPITGFLVLIFTGYVMRREVFVQYLSLSPFWGNFWYRVIRYVSPWGLLLVFIANFINL